MYTRRFGFNIYLCNLTMKRFSGLDASGVNFIFDFVSLVVPIHDEYI